MITIEEMAAQYHQIKHRCPDVGFQECQMQDNENYDCDTCRAKWLFRFLDAHDVVVKDENQTAPCTHIEENRNGQITQEYLDGRLSLIEAGFVRTQRLPGVK